MDTLNSYYPLYPPNPDKENLSEFVSQGKYQTMSQSELWKSLLDLINNIIFKYEKECEMSDIPKVVIDKMKAKNNDTIVLTMDLIDVLNFIQQMIFRMLQLAF